MCPGVLTFALAWFAPVATQSDASDATSGWNDPAFEGSHFAAAIERWTSSGMQGYGLGLHLATMPADLTAAYEALSAIAAGNFGHADDASLVQLFELFEPTLYAAPVPVCSQALGGNAEGAFAGMLAAADSTTAEDWVGAFDALVLDMIAPGTVTPAADADDLQVALVPVIAKLSPEQLKLWMRHASEPAALTESESCDVARMVFTTINRIPDAQRAGVLRGSMMMSARRSRRAGGVGRLGAISAAGRTPEHTASEVDACAA